MTNITGMTGDRRHGTRTAMRVALAAITLSAGVATTACGNEQPQGQNGPTGQARVIERKGPEVEIRSNGRAQVVAMFPGAASQQSDQPGSGDVEVVMVESQMQAPQTGPDGQPAPGGGGQASVTGREVLFASRDAKDGLVRYGVDPAGNGRKMMLLARVGGMPVEVRQVGNTEGVMVFAVAAPQKPQAQTAQNGSQPGQPVPNSAEANAGENGAQPAAQPVPQPAQAQAIPEQSAIIVVYTGGSAQ